jgi:hypothetical protein
MEPLVQAAIVAAIPVTLGLVVTVATAIVRTILNAYKGQAASTTEAKNSEISILKIMLEQERDKNEKQEDRIRRLEERVDTKLDNIAKALGV